MIINHNMGAINAHRQMTANTTTTQKSTEKLSSGLRINRAGDDAAGLAISEKMRGQIRGLDQASRNSQDGISLIQTAEGSLNETHSILQRMRELSVQSANDTNTEEDRKNLQDEMDQLTEEIDRISNTTEFNTKKLLNGEMGKGVTAAVANVNTNEALDKATAETTKLIDLKDKDGNLLGIAEDSVIEISYVKNGETKTDKVTVTDANTLADLFKEANAGADVKATVTNGELQVEAKTEGTADAIHGLTITVKNATTGKENTKATNALSSFAQTTAAADKRSDGQATLQIGANTGQNLKIDIDSMDSSTLGVKNLNISNQGSADIATKVIDEAITKVSTQRSKLGAYQNRLEHTINNLGTASENLTASESRIRDVDMAAEMMNLTKVNVLTQASQAMLAQANQRPNQVLSLLQ